LNGSNSAWRSPPAKNPRHAASSGPKKKFTTFDPKQGGFLKINRKIDRKTGRATVLNY
jgi:hypothetical protein